MALSFPWIYPVRAAQVIFGIIVLGLTAYFVSLAYHSPPRVNFMLFNGVWTGFFATPYLILAPIYAPNLAHRLIIVAIEGVTMIFWFAGFIALAVAVSSSYFESCRFSPCNSLRAATVFGALEWALFVATAGVSAVGVFRSRNNSSTKPASPANIGV